MTMKLSGMRLHLSVEDTGIGIPPDQLERVFEEFAQVEGDAKRSFEGTGLGLPMVKSFVSSLQGTLDYRSDLGEGTMFQIIIPGQENIDMVAETRTIELSQPSQSSPDSATENSATDKVAYLKIAQQPYNILIIDDNPLNCEVAKDILAHEGFPSECRTDGREGLKFAKETKPDLILLDMMMPEYSGEDFIRDAKMCEILVDIPIIIVTARASQQDLIAGLNLGADDYLAKPIVSDEMVVRVRNTLSRVDLTRNLAEKRTLEKTLAEAQEVHSSLGKSSEVEIPHVKIVDHYKPAELTSGDWFGIDYHPKTKRLFVLLGDVTGHGVKAALVTVAVAGAFRSAVTTIKDMVFDMTVDDSMAILSDGVDAAVSDARTRIDRNMTMIFLCIEVDSGHVTYVNGGHNELYRCSPTAAEMVLVPGSFVLG